MNNKEFWMVYRDKGSNSTIKHYDEGLAITEAERLSKENIGATFYVLHAKYGYQAKSYVEKIELEELEKEIL